MILVLGAILLAYAYPPLGATHLYPQITAMWIAVMIIFILAGTSVKTEQFAQAFRTRSSIFYNSDNSDKQWELAMGPTQEQMERARVAATNRKEDPMKY